MYDWLVSLRKLKNNPCPATQRHIWIRLETYNAAPAKMMLTGATLPGADDTVIGSAEAINRL